MRREIYYWAIFIVAVLAVALYLRFYNTEQYSPVLSFSSNSTVNGTIYPLQELHLQILVNNTGSTVINDMGIDVLINGNTTYVYGVTVPAGKTAVVKLNYTPSVPGEYNFTAVADPSHYYNIPDRSAAQASYSVNVLHADAEGAYSFIPSNGIVSEGSVKMDCVNEGQLNCPGFIYNLFLQENYNITQFNITRHLKGLDSFITPFLFTISSAVENISISYANYTSGNSVYSIWLRGYLAPQIMEVGAIGANLSTSNLIINGQNVTLVHLKGNESLCSWYSHGWIKSVATEGASGCVELLQEGAPTLASPISSGIAAVNPFAASNIVVTANYTQVYGNRSSAGWSALLENRTFAYASVTTNSFTDQVCGGTVTRLHNMTYCNFFVFPTNGSIGPRYYLIGTTGVRGNYNMTSYLIVNNSQLPVQAPISMALLNATGVTGNSLLFVPGFSGSCIFNATFGCGNVNFGNSTVSFGVQNSANSIVKFTGVGCYLNPPKVFSKLNITVNNSRTANVTVACYNQGIESDSLPFGVAFHVQLNYTIGNQTRQVVGLLT